MMAVTFSHLMLVLALVPVLAVSPVLGGVTSITVVSEESRFLTELPSVKLHEGVVMGWAAKANYSDEVFQNGWAYLEVETNPHLSDSKQAYFAGFIEGMLTKKLIYNSWRNTMEGFCERKGAAFCRRLREFLKQNHAWMTGMIQKHGDTDPLWHQVSLVQRQLQGITNGYNLVSPLRHISAEDFLWLNLNGDLEDLDSVLSPNRSSPMLRGDGHCSALVKLLPGNTDLYTSHVTWNPYQSMLRIQKKYIFPFNSLEESPSSNLIVGNTVTFSSYPGIIHSADDYYLLSSGLLSMETTIGNSNPDLWVNVTPEGELQEWIRVLVANRLATDGRSWTNIFKKYNSGTYNNQWMVIDYKLFTPRNMIKPNTLWVLEQLPGLVVAGDQSHRLQESTYWPSYNSPFYPEVFNASGLPALVQKYGDWFSYDKTPRAMIFARDHGKVKDLGSMIKLMRYNDFKNDPLSKCSCDPPFSGENAISARNDLNPENGTYPFSQLGHRSHAGTDMKVTSSEMFKDLEFLAINGPTYDQQPVFKWSTSGFGKDTPRYGHPDSFKFPVVHKVW